MATREEIQAAKESLSKRSSTWEEVESAARTLQRAGEISAVHENLKSWATGDGVQAEITAKFAEFLLRDVAGLGIEKRLEMVRKVLEQANDRLDKPALAAIQAEFNKQDVHLRAERILNKADTSTAKEMFDLAKALKRFSSFSYAADLFARAWESKDDTLSAPQKLAARQQQALCTYKDPARPREERLDTAFEILQDAGLKDDPSSETLGLAGAIYKRKWEVGNRLLDLRTARDYYLRGYEVSKTQPPTIADDDTLQRNWDWDAGYTGINAAFVNDQLATQEPDDDRSDELRAKADGLREELVANLSQFLRTDGLNPKATQDWWLLVTLAEASFGLALAADEGKLSEAFAEARTWAEKAKALAGTSPWEFRSTVQQLVSLARLRDVDPTPDGDPRAKLAYDFLTFFLEGVGGRLDDLLRGKIGLGLSGGGFRASLYHIGVLAKLAELDVLRHVEVLSCVSGGSIIGAHYYLELQKWFEEHDESELEKDGKPNRKPFVELVKRVQRDFLAGVQKNIRTRVATNVRTGFHTLVRPTYTRTERVGELYEEHLFSRVQDGREGRRRMMGDLIVEPKGVPPLSFFPARDNWLRQAPVPVLIINATTLNTGHNWQFTASWMGEPRWIIADKIDGNARLRRLYYWQAPFPHHQMPVGRAVAASSCVPGLFEPIILAKLYPGYAVRLVDGGVHDNQGVGGLLEQDCSWLIISDASGQLTTAPQIDGGSLASFGRMSNIQMSRIREEQLKDVEARKRGKDLCNVVTVHLREGLNVDPVGWIGCKRPDSKDGRGEASNFTAGILKEVQTELAGIRTDLDSFTDLEAFALMTSGYLMIESKQREFIEQGLGSLPGDDDDEKCDWDFLKVKSALSDDKDPQYRRMRKHLKVGAKLQFKGWWLKLIPNVITLLLVVVVVGGVFSLAAWLLNQAVPGFLPALKTYWPWVFAVYGVFLIVKVIANRVMLGSFFVRHALSTTIFAIILLVLWPVANLHVWLFDRIFLENGAVKRGN